MELNCKSHCAILVNWIKQIKPNYNCSKSSLIEFKILAFAVCVRWDFDRRLAIGLKLAFQVT